MCLFRECFPENQAFLNSLLFFLGSIVIIAESLKLTLCPLWEVCAYTNDVSLCRSMAV